MRGYNRLFSHEFAEILQGEFKELQNLDEEEVRGRLINLDIECYQKCDEKTSFWIRLTIPLLVVVIALGLIFLPVYYIFTGRFKYQSRFMNTWFNKLNI